MFPPPTTHYTFLIQTHDPHMHSSWKEIGDKAGFIVVDSGDSEDEGDVVIMEERTQASTKNQVLTGVWTKMNATVKNSHPFLEVETVEKSIAMLYFQPSE